MRLLSATLAPAFILLVPVLPAKAQTVINVGGAGDLVNALTTVSTNPGTSYTLNITSNITLGAGDTLPAINSASTIAIEGNGHTLDGGNVQRGFFAYAGDVSISDLAIRNAVAEGGSGGSGGGGGAGLGGALFVASGANVTVSNVSLTGNAASGGAGGGVGGTGGGGGMGGNGGESGGGVGGTGSGGGGGLGAGAAGGNALGGAGGGGIALGAASGGAGGGGGAGGAAGGGGGGGGAGGAGGGGGIGGSGFSGGFGGGSGGTGGDGGFGGGSGGLAGNGGFGGGGGKGGSGGFGGGDGGGVGLDGGGGGAGMGGALFVMQGGTLAVAGSFFVDGNSVTAGASGGGSATGGSAYGSGIFLQGNGTVTFSPGTGGTQTISDAIADQTGSGGTGVNAGSWSLTKTGEGRLVLRGENTYAGATTISAGTLQLGNDFSGSNRLSSTTAVTVEDGATLSFGQTSQRAGSIAGAGRIEAAFIPATGAYSGTLTIGANGASTAFSGDLLVGTVNKTGAGTQILSGTHALQTLGILGGAIRIGAGGWTGVGGAVPNVVMFGGSMLDLDGQAFAIGTVNDVFGTGTIQLGTGGTLTLTDGSTTFSGEIAGSGAVIKQGASTFTLNGATSFTGQLDIQQGTLRLGSSGGRLADTLAIKVAAGATFDVNGQTDTVGSLAGAGDVTLGTGSLTVGGSGASTTFAGAISGDGSFAKTGAGALTLNGTNTYTGTTTLDAGTLLVNGSIASSSGVTVGGGATLGGTGVLAPTVILDDGKLAPGNSIGTITVNGPLSFGAGSAYEVEVSPSAADRTDVDAVGGPGTADLSGATVLAIYEPGSYVAKRYVILTAEGGFAGTTFAGLSGAAPGGFTQSLDYDANGVYLVLSPLQLAGLTQNQQAVSDALLTYFDDTGGLPAVFTGLSAGELTLISAENGTGALAAALGSGSEFISLLGETSGGTDDGAAGAPLAYADAENSDHLAKRFEAGFPEAASAPAASRFRAWGSVLGGAAWLDGNAIAGSQNITSTAYGLVSGVDYAAEGTRLGGALGGSWTSVAIANGLGSARAGSFHAGVRAHHDFGGLHVSGAAAYGLHDFSTSRVVAGETYSAALIGHSISARAEAGARWRTSFADVTPYAAFQSVNLFTPAYTEAGGGAGTFALAYQAATTSENRMELGARLAKRIRRDDGILTLSGKLAWAHYLNPARSVTAGFASLPGTSFVTRGATKAQNAALVSAAADFSWRSGMAASLSVDGEFGQGTASVSGKARLTLRW